MIKKLVIATAIGAAVVLGSAIASFGLMKNTDPFDVWDEADEFDYEQAVLDWENERYEEELRESEEDN